MLYLYVDLLKKCLNIFLDPEQSDRNVLVRKCMTTFLDLHYDLHFCMNKYKVQVILGLKEFDSLGFNMPKWASKTSNSEIFCKVCVNTIYVEAKGFQVIVQHVSTKKYKSNFKFKMRF